MRYAQERHFMLAPDFVALISAFNAAQVRYLLVGGYAVGVHAKPRATKDLDLWVDATPANARRVISALATFGAPMTNLSAADFARPGQFYVMGRPPIRIDVLTEASGLSFRKCWLRKTAFDAAKDVPCWVVGIDDLLINKRAAGRPQDLADVHELERVRTHSRRRRS